MLNEGKHLLLLFLHLLSFAYHAKESNKEKVTAA
jgi:hypothetical protein